MMTEDFTQFLNADEFADNATLSGAAVCGIFDNANVVTEEGMGMATTRPIFTLATTNVPSSPVGRTFVRNGVTYAVAAHEPDGTGMSVLVLERT